MKNRKEMKKWMLVVLVLAGSVSWGQAQIKIGNRTINTKKVLNAASEVASAITLSDEDVAALCRESVGLVKRSSCRYKA